MKRAARIAIAAALLGCSERTPLERTAPSGSAPDGELSLPPSASMPRASLPGHATPDTIRPAGEIAPDSLFEGFGGVVPGVGDLSSIVEAYEAYYHDEHDRIGSLVEGGIDPAIAREARRRTANDWGFAGPDGWSLLVDQLPDGARVELADRILDADTGLARELHP